VWWYTLIIQAFGKLRWEENVFEASLTYIVKPCLKKPRVEGVAQWQNTYLAFAKSGFSPSLQGKKRETSVNICI
jgi:hypothetical protein